MVSNLIKLTSAELRRNILYNRSWIGNCLFLLINMFIFPFSIGSSEDSFGSFFVSGVMTSILLATVLITNNIFDEDAKDGTLHQYIVFGIPFHYVFLSKVIVSAIEFAFIICLTLPIASNFYNVPFTNVMNIVLLILLSTPLLVAVGVFGALLTLNSTSNSTIMILLVFPLLISALIMLSMASIEIMNGSNFAVAFSYVKINLGLFFILLPILIWLANFLKYN